jgi:hypothetical protein
MACLAQHIVTWKVYYSAFSKIVIGWRSLAQTLLRDLRFTQAKCGIGQAAGLYFSVLYRESQLERRIGRTPSGLHGCRCAAFLLIVSRLRNRVSFRGSAEAQRRPRAWSIYEIWGSASPLNFQAQLNQKSIVHHSKIGASMTASGHTRSFGDVCLMSGLPLESGLKSDIVRWPLRAMSGREQVQHDTP